MNNFFSSFLYKFFCDHYVVFSKIVVSGRVAKEPLKPLFKGIKVPFFLKVIFLMVY